jgi:hypothetical protein
VSTATARPLGTRGHPTAHALRRRCFGLARRVRKRLKTSWANDVFAQSINQTTKSKSTDELNRDFGSPTTTSHLDVTKRMRDGYRGPTTCPIRAFSMTPSPTATARKD